MATIPFGWSNWQPQPFGNISLVTHNLPFMAQSQFPALAFFCLLSTASALFLYLQRCSNILFATMPASSSCSSFTQHQTKPNQTKLLGYILVHAHRVPSRSRNGIHLALHLSTGLNNNANWDKQQQQQQQEEKVSRDAAFWRAPGIKKETRPERRAETLTRDLTLRRVWLAFWHLFFFRRAKKKRGRNNPV